MFTMIIPVILSILTIVWTLIVIPFRFFGYRLYKIKNAGTVITMSNKIKDYSLIIEDGDKPSSFFSGKWYIGYIHNTTSSRGDSQTEIFVLTSKDQYESLIKMDNNCMEDNKDKPSFTYYVSEGCAFNVQYKGSIFSIDQSPNDKQHPIVEKIIDGYKNKINSRITVYIHGKPGSGKSTIPLLIAQQLNAHYCNKYKPTTPGHLFSTLYRTCSPTKDKPLIVVLEEVDGILVKLSNGISAHNKYCETEITDKSTWNSFLDEGSIGLYKNVIFIMTSNVNPKCFDESYLREGRVDMQIEL